MIPQMIAALYVQKRGCYSKLPDVDMWDEARERSATPVDFRDALLSIAQGARNT